MKFKVVLFQKKILVQEMNQDNEFFVVLGVT